jgi:hypothetical protein
MTTVSSAVEHPSQRLIVHLPRPYDEARELYETLVPEADRARFGQMVTWQATLEVAAINAPRGFMRYYRGDGGFSLVLEGDPLPGGQPHHRRTHVPPRPRRHAARSSAHPGCRLEYLLALLIIDMGGDLPSELRHTA